MVISPWLIYFAGQCDTLKTTSWCLFTFYTVATVCCITDKKQTLETKKAAELGWKLGVLFLILGVFIPSTTTAYKMMIIPAVVTSSVTQKLPDELQQFIDKELKVDNATNK